MSGKLPSEPRHPGCSPRNNRNPEHSHKHKKEDFPLMRKLLFSMIIMACAASFSFAQSDDYNKVDIYAGFSHARIDFGGSGSDFEGFNGVEGAVTGNISRYIGLKGDYAFH